MGTMTKAVLGGLGTAFFFVFLASEVTGSKERSKKELTVAEALDKLASATNALKGQEVGPNIIVNRASVENGRRLTYYYTIPTAVDGEFDQELADELTDDVKRRACADPILRRALEGGAKIRYAYRQSDSATIFNVDMNQWACAGVSQG